MKGRKAIDLDWGRTKEGGICGGSRPWNPRKRHRCDECGVLEGQLHRLGCEMECCPRCFGSVVCCDCYPRRLPTKGRIPYLRLPFICVRCGQLWPEFFWADDWPAMIPKTAHEEILCRDCYEVIKGFARRPRAKKRTRAKGK